jgi:hypothetical protein
VNFDQGKMITDLYIKTVLTVIALSVGEIAVKLWTSDEWRPTLGNLYGLSAIQDESVKREKAREIYSRLPISVVRVDGTVDAEVTNEANVRKSDKSGLPGLPGLPN